ncbi:hypothetical protein [Mycolicibacterium sp. CR10]|uniref:hypothetical protein n=1 Tax=Mycolicibacterium sp. CR10 TaxID=2562314 RepID=UPI0010BFBC17|nr:hypothetical protein [Mycolicibacterium sp. CR10]
MTQPGVGPVDPSVDDSAENVETRWPDYVGANAVAVNQVLFAWDQTIQDMLYMYLGHIAPPPWLSVEVGQERIAELGYKLDILPKGAFVLSRTRAEELWTVLGRHLGKLPPE